MKIPKITRRESSTQRSASEQNKEKDDNPKETHYTKGGRIFQSIHEVKQRDDMVHATDEIPKPELTSDTHKTEVGNSNTMRDPSTPISHTNKAEEGSGKLKEESI